MTRTRSRTVELLRGLAAMGLLVTCLVGIPAALVLVGPHVAPSSWPRPTTLTAPDDGQLFLGAVLGVAWVAWIAFAATLVLEIGATVRNVPTPRLPALGTLQSSAAALVAAAGVLFASSHSAIAPSARPVSPILHVASVESTIAAIPLQDSVSPPTTTHRTITVERHDTLWSIAEQHLGSGSRFPEIVKLNLGARQHDGRSLTSSHWIYPGWVLRLPADARASGTEKTYVVRPGDTLSEIAQAQLGDTGRTDELFDLNEGEPMGDGERLEHPELIRPGWVLNLTPPAAERTEVVESPAPAGDDVAPDSETAIAVPVLPKSTPAPAESQHQPVESPGLESNVLEVGAALALGLVTATGLVHELRRRRRQQQRTRAAGSRIPMPAAPAARAEREAAAHEAPVTVDTAARALRAMAASCRDAGRALPEVLLVRLSPSSVRLQLLSDDAEPVSPFVLEDERMWRLAEPCSEAGEDDPYPALLTLGVDGAEVLLLNLESVGSLNVVDAGGDVFRALLADAAVGPFSTGSSLVFADGFDEIVSVLDPIRCRVVRDAEAAQAELGARRDEVGRVLGPAAARTRHQSSEGLLPDIVFSREALAVTELSWSGVCHVSADASSKDSDCELVVESASVARLSPHGVVFEPQRLPVAGWQHVVDLLGKAVAPSPEPTVVEVREAVARALPEVPATLLDLRDDAAEPPRLLVLGRVHVERADDSAAPHRRRRASELVAYLALHPGASGREIDEALWPGRRVEKSTRNPFISRARQWLGKGPDGEPYLPLVADGGSYRLRPEVSCDWHDFVRFSQLGLESGAPGATALSAALDLVRGRPFLGVDPATYTWAEADIQEMISAIVDVAHVLAEMRLAVGDFRGAQEAAARGMLAEPCSELLYRDAMKAALATGDLDELDRLSSRLRSEITLIDPEETFDDETIELLSSRSQLIR